MPWTAPYSTPICARCLRAQLRHAPRTLSGTRPFSASAVLPLACSLSRRDASDKQDKKQEDEKPEGAMTQRLRDLSESDLSGTRPEDIQNAGFSEDLKEQLLSRMSEARSARRLSQQAFSVADLPSSAGKSERENASAEPWSGTESTADASLRMLNDAYKPLKVSPRPTSTPARVPKRVDTGRPAAKAASPAAKGARLANARDRSSSYTYLKDPSISPEEREKLRKQLKERFGQSARTMPATLQGLASLANERIEDAIQRGQFRNLPSRGKKIERDYNASNPFIDTTEYLMNKMIQKQEIVPPWIEKQQELAGAAARFRARLRNDWRRHAARSIAARGGPLEDQIRRAEGYAAAELALNPPRVQTETLNAVAADGQLSQISLSGELRVPKSSAEAPSVETHVEVTTVPDPDSAPSASTTTCPTQSQESQPQSPAAPQPELPEQPRHPPFRDPTWLQTEHSYHTAAISSLNSLARSYNLMAPDAAKKPYFSLDRELRSCFADVAPSLAHEIRERAIAPAARAAAARNPSAGLVDSLTGAGAHVARVRDEDGGKQYGFRQLLRDVFGKA